MPHLRTLKAKPRKNPRILKQPVSSGLPTIIVGSGTPGDNVGSTGDVYFDSAAANKMYNKSAASWIAD